jgi:hypothetical protein
MKKSNEVSPKIREPAAQMVQEHRGEYPWLWAAVESITATKGIHRRGPRKVSGISGTRDVGMGALGPS